MSAARSWCGGQAVSHRSLSSDPCLQCRYVAWANGGVSLVALQEAGLLSHEAEIILVNDGSTDNSLQVARALSSPYPIVIVDQPNSGRFMARKAGLLASGKEDIFFIDSRVFIHPQALKYLFEQRAHDPSKEVWNGHVIVEKKGNIIARFGYAIAFIGWRRYLAHPRDCSFGLKDFDHYPKGNGVLLCA